MDCIDIDVRYNGNLSSGVEAFSFDNSVVNLDGAIVFTRKDVIERSRDKDGIMLDDVTIVLVSEEDDAKAFIRAVMLASGVTVEDLR